MTDGTFSSLPIYSSQMDVPTRPRRMVVGDIYLCHTPIMARGDDLRKIWMWYASQSDATTEPQK